MYATMAYKQKRAKMLSVRASEEEWERVKNFCQRVIRHHPYMTEADVLRELIGLIDTGLITPRMRLELLDPEYSVRPLGTSAETEMTDRVRRDAEATLAVERAQSKQEEGKRKSSRRKKPEKPAA